MNDSLEAFVMEKLSEMTANEEVLQMLPTNKLSVKKVSSKVASKVLIGHESTSNHLPSIRIPHIKSTSIPLSNPTKHPTSQPRQHALPPNNMGSTNAVELKGKKNMTRNIKSPVPDKQ